jgi:hypothetical protein
MKTWKIKITAPDEQTALEYLKVLVSDFKASIALKQDMNNCVIEGSKKNEKLICNLVRK